MKTKLVVFAVSAIAALIAPYSLRSQTITSFDGIDASQISGAQYAVDQNGAVGTLQYMEWVNNYYQAFNKTTHAAIWPSPQAGDTPWVDAGLSDCYGNAGGEGTILFDHMASVWVIAKRGAPAANTYYYCIAVSNTDDLSSSSLAWFTYQFNITASLGMNSTGNVYYPDWPRLGTWSDAYYATFDLEDPNNAYTEIGVVVCAFDRSNIIINGTANPQQCFSDPNPIPTDGALYLSHSLIPADIEGTTAPPTGMREYLVSIENPVNNQKTLTSTQINRWKFYVDWSKPTKSTFTHSKLKVSSYEPGCYEPNDTPNTFCVPEPSTAKTGNYVDSVGDRMEPRFAFRNFGTYQSFLLSQTVQVGAVGSQQTGVLWYEMRGKTPTLYQTGIVSPDTSLFRFVPSIAQDKTGNAAVGYSVSNSTTHPGIRASYWSLASAFSPTELTIKKGSFDVENSELWGNITSMTVDPSDDCTFWYVNRYYPSNETGTELVWNTRIANFKLSTCN
jgi:hypothetical protein